MEKKKNKDPCAGCVWKLWTGTSEKVLCSLPVYRRHGAVIEEEMCA